MNHCKYCTDPSQCWEPCGELGHSEEYMRVASPDVEKQVQAALASPPQTADTAEGLLIGAKAVLAELLQQVNAECERNGEGDFETGDSERILERIDAYLASGQSERKDAAKHAAILRVLLNLAAGKSAGPPLSNEQILEAMGQILQRAVSNIDAALAAAKEKQT